MIKSIEKLVELMGGLQLFTFPFAFSCVIGTILYYYNPFGFGLYLGIISLVLGIIVGIWYANRIHQQEGTVNHLSTISRMSELEQNENRK